MQYLYQSIRTLWNHFYWVILWFQLFSSCILEMSESSTFTLRIFRDSMNRLQTSDQLQSLYLAVRHLQEFRNTFRSVYCRFCTRHTHITTRRVETEILQSRKQSDSLSMETSSLTSWGQRHESSVFVYWFNWDRGADWSDSNPLSVDLWCHMM